MPSPFTWNPNVPAPTDLIKIFPTTPQYVSDKLTLATVLQTLTPTGTPTTGFRMFQDSNTYILTFNCKTFDNATWNITQDDATAPSVVWFKTASSIFGVGYCPPGGTGISVIPLQMDAAGDLTLNTGNLVITAGYIENPGWVSNSIAFWRDEPGKPGSLFGDVQFRWDGINFTIGQPWQALISNIGQAIFHKSIDIYSANSAWGDSLLRLGANDSYTWQYWVDANGLFYLSLIAGGTWQGQVFHADQGRNFIVDTQSIDSGNSLHYGISYFGASNQMSIDTAGNINTPSINCPTFFSNPTFTGTVYFHGGATYFGTGNQSAFDSAGYLNVGNSVNISTNLGVGGGCTIGGNCSMGEIITAGVDAGSAKGLKWDGGATLWQEFVGATLVYSVTANWCDERLKSEIKPVTVDALEQLKKVEMVSYTVENKDMDPPSSPKHYDIGFTAQRTKPHVPDAIIETEQGPFLDHVPMIAYLVKAVQQLTSKVEALEAKLA